MSLIDDVKALCDRLAPRGWRDLLLSVTANGLDISQANAASLAAALIQPIGTINRGHAGFDDFHGTSNLAIDAGRPSHSLLYHALASPAVHPTTSGQPSSNPQDYPTLHELDTLENYIYSLMADRSDLDDTFVAVFAYQYRAGSRTPHLRHADIAYSRTGIARVGTADPHYDASRRSFWILPESGTESLPVLPARYGAFLARRGKPGANGSVQHGHNGQQDQDYIFPLHKLFDGTECLAEHTISLDYLEFHRNEKLRMTHRLPIRQGGLPVPAGFDISKAPYVRDSRNGGNLTSLQPAGSSTLVVPTPARSLVRTASQNNTVTNSDKLVHFMVPAIRQVGLRSTRFAGSTLEIPASGKDRLSPEYVNIRHEIDPNGPVNQTPINLNTLATPAFETKMKNGGYAAAHFIDDSCDGCIEVLVDGLPPALQGVESVPAFSLVTAPDFFPLADQSEVETDQTIVRVSPLSKGRLPVNPSLPRPSDLTSFAFDQEDKTVTAIVGAFATGQKISIVGQVNRMTSYLPDAASNVFAPGWDASRSRNRFGPFLTSSGLGSPFPEDAKLCAALASFWPAAAPDNGRTFGNQGFGNQLPMLDEELGFHPNHDQVLSGHQVSRPGWDGEFGPFFETSGRQLHVNFVAIERSDYVNHALAGQVDLSLTASIQSEELISRHQALIACERILELGPQPDLCLVVFRTIIDWQEAGPGRSELRGAGYLLEFAELRGGQMPTADLRRVHKAVHKRHVCQFGENGIAYKNGGAAFEFKPA